MSDTAASPTPATGPRTPRFAALILLRNLRLVVKLPLLVTGVAFLAACLVSITAYLDARDILDDQVARQQDSLVHTFAESLHKELVSIEASLTAQGTNPTVLAAANSFALAWDATEGDAQQVLRTAYITGNPNPVERRAELTTTGTGTQYDIMHTKYHPYFRSLMGAQDLLDILLVDRGGRIIYSAAKTETFAAQLTDGALSDTPLARAVRDATAQGIPEFADFDGALTAERDAAMAIGLHDRSGTQVGTLVYLLRHNWIDALLRSNGDMGKTSDAYVIGPDGRMRSSARFPDAPDWLEPAPRLEAVEAAMEDAEVNMLASTGLHGRRALVTAEALTFGHTRWVVVVQQAEEELLSPLIRLRNSMILQLAGMMAVIALIGWFAGRSISKPFTVLGQRLRAMASGDYASPIPFTHRGEDVGDLARNLENLRNRLATAEGERTARDQQAAEQQVVVDRLSAGIAELAAGNLTAEITAPFASDYEGLRRGFNNALTRLNETITSLVGAASEIDSNAREVENASNDLSQKAIEQAANLEETAAAITELSASVKSTADSASDADRVMARAREDAETSGRVVGHAMTAMDQISGSSQKITQVTSVIEDLAFQTNLLALNAGVEAARAGEAGRGFAVVASEVRALAQRSSEAAKEINALISESAENVVNGVDLVDKAGKSFESLISDFEKVSASVSTIAAAAREQSAGLEEINTAVDQLDGVTQKNAAVATQVHGTGKVMVNEAAKLNQIAASFRIVSGGPLPTRRELATRPAAAAQQVVNAPGMTAPADDSWAEF
ncbi:methyl-accepting chemotaxis protein [Pseudooceanicola nanhaiensis]|uniref:methyl-accepting chemotaxis protein n=1 Tax=Pseudooceanicola nanhaiensis TaxID=375761 RepID=UPI001CD578B6|nr:methyl-accepting chemotaxis protein [Pseudooceanicola nanhaiensis]MCA0921399.1 methyl-accepting chemotaxis protein [Pseudooceanicola nanhaiensis]